ncbi:MAG TPA: hypothetical protein VJ725_27610 [Thermoanaerobaculia bacterium]|nr:hypothetical protein [Thermoanaerobaculia bacterium]
MVAGRWIAFAGLLLLLARGGLLLSREPCLGVADNRDYWRVARPAGIDARPPVRKGVFVVCTYVAGESRLATSFSSPALLAVVSRRFDWGFDVPRDRFDLRQLGLLYWVAAAALLAGCVIARLPVLLALFFAWVVIDPGFLLFFNSLYADPALILGILATVCLLPVSRLGEPRDAGRSPPRTVLALLLLAAALAGFSKMQYAPFPLVMLACWGLALGIRRQRPAAFEAMFLGLLALLAVLAPMHFLKGAAPRFLEVNNYNAVYGGIAKVASHPSRTLARLGIPEEYRSLPAKDFFALDVEQRDDPVLSHLGNLSRVRLAWQYLRDPRALAGAAERIELELWKSRTHPRGTRVREESRRRDSVFRTPEQFSRFRGYLLAVLPPRALWLFLVVMIAALGARAWRGTWSSLDTASLFLLAWLVAQCAVTVLGDGFVSLHQHLLGARLAFDLLLVLLASRGLSFLAGRLVRATPHFMKEGRQGRSWLL